MLSTVGADGQPYGIPLNYAFKDNSIYFHCALSGQKFENISGDSRVSFCVIGNTKVLPDKFGTEYESVVVFGAATEIHGSERYNALLWLLEKYCSGFLNEGKQYIESKDSITKVIKIKIRHITGKARR